MENDQVENDQVVAPTNKQGKCRAFLQRMGRALAGLFNQASVFSLFVFGLNGAFLGTGHYLFYRLHFDYVPFVFFLPCLVLMLAYALGYGLWVKSTPSFDGGTVSARSVMRWIATSTALSFAVVNYEMIELGWRSDPTDSFPEWACTCLIPAVLIFFCVVYGKYAEHSDHDMLPENARRRGSGRRTAAFLTFVTMAVFLFRIYYAATATTLVVPAIWGGLAGFTVSFGVCFLCLIIFQSTVSVANDRGFKVG